MMILDILALVILAGICISFLLAVGFVIWLVVFGGPFR